MTSQVKYLLLFKETADKKTLVIFSLFPGSCHVDIVFLEAAYFLATIEGFVPDSTLVIALYFSESDNLFFFKPVILHNIQL